MRLARLVLPETLREVMFVVARLDPPETFIFVRIPTVVMFV